MYFCRRLLKRMEKQLGWTSMASESESTWNLLSGTEWSSEEQSAENSQTHVPTELHSGLNDDTNTQMKPLPPEVWGMVVGNLEEIGDFARLQLVSPSFWALVKDNCWKKVTRIEVELTVKGWVRVVVDTAVPSQRRRLQTAGAAELLEKLIQKAPNTTAVHLDFDGRNTDAFEKFAADIVLQRLLDALASISKIKIQEFAMEDLSASHSMDTLQALARFLNSKNQSLTSLKAIYCKQPIPAEVVQAFHDCQGLEHVKIEGSDHLIESILHEKTQLQTLVLAGVGVDAPASAVALLESGTKLRQFRCSDNVLLAYDQQVKQRNRFQDHPLRSLEKLQIGALVHCPPFSWALFLSLEELNIDWMLVSIQDFMSMVQSFLMQWGNSYLEKALEWRISTILIHMKGNLQLEHLAEVATGVQEACGCHVTLNTYSGTDSHYTLVFNKGKATLKILIK